MSDARADHSPWPMRAALLLVLGALCGLAVDQLIREGDSFWQTTDSVGRFSLAIFVTSAGILFAFTLERARWLWSLGFALAGGLALAGIYYWNGSPEHHGADDGWRALASFMSVAIAAPLFQTVRDEGRLRLPYVAVHAHSWSNVVLWFAAWTFVLISWLLGQLLAELFDLIHVHLLRTLMNKPWFNWMLIGGALGAALGLLRDRDRVVGLLQRVVTTVLSVLAPILAAGLVLFVLALPFAGLGVLWEQTRATTPIVLACVIGAIILANAVIGNSAEEEARGRILRISAMALGAVMLPLVAIAALSTGVRIGQHGLTPARLWAIVFIAIAAAYALCYAWALVRGRWGWAGRVRPANIRIAVAVCALALVLATPLAQFGAISTRSQLARLESGRVSADRFDWRALRFDFGESGVRALERLRASSPNPAARRFAQMALSARFPYDLSDLGETLRARAIARNLRVVPGGGPLPPELQDIFAPANCVGDDHCVLFYQPGAEVAVLVMPGFCEAWMEGTRDYCDLSVTAYYRNGDRWRSEPPAPVAAGAGDHYRRLRDALAQGRAEIRTVPRRQVFINGEPVGQAF